MAKRRKHHATAKRRTSHRRRVSGVKDVNATQILFIVGGALAARVIGNKLTASTNTTMQKLGPYAGILAGVVLPMVTKNAMVKSLSLGLVGGGAISAFGPSGLKVISGMEATIGYPYNVIPYKKVVAGVMENGDYITKPNFSGSGKSQMNVISGIAHMAGCM